ncbi:hypothetical protein F3Y22_tig00112738pilonHSYRG01095 [Hibiscus syriacus]|uniref:BAG domain-containing protein n=1 Tax=Hibiscus syriacus TaxID=106335 RepID=A0A6A2Y413_HIBSY|nr:hypothetical protein F3Y22_tig00112738pilonHSYRG01095 [Hibiscus syriacus]
MMPFSGYMDSNPLRNQTPYPQHYFPGFEAVQPYFKADPSQSSMMYESWPCSSSCSRSLKIEEQENDAKEKEDGSVANSTKKFPISNCVDSTRGEGEKQSQNQQKQDQKMQMPLPSFGYRILIGSRKQMKTEINKGLQTASYNSKQAPFSVEYVPVEHSVSDAKIDNHNWSWRALRTRMLLKQRGRGKQAEVKDVSVKRDEDAPKVDLGKTVMVVQGLLASKGQSEDILTKASITPDKKKKLQSEENKVGETTSANQDQVSGSLSITSVEVSGQPTVERTKIESHESKRGNKSKFEEVVGAEKEVGSDNAANTVEMAHGQCKAEKKECQMLKQPSSSNLPSVDSSVREARKSLVKELVTLQEKLDALASKWAEEKIKDLGSAESADSSGRASGIVSMEEESGNASAAFEDTSENVNIIKESDQDCLNVKDGKDEETTKIPGVEQGLDEKVDNNTVEVSIEHHTVPRIEVDVPPNLEQVTHMSSVPELKFEADELVE